MRPTHIFFVESADLSRVSHSPGVYIFKDKDGNVLYVGKAKDLKKRLYSYFKPNPQFSPKNALMMSRAFTFEVILTNTEKEALILENTLIKEYRPKFNIAWRDDKSYPYIKISLDGEYPQLLVTRKRLKDNAYYFGPYTNSLSVRETIKTICYLFGLRTCSDHYMINRDRPCLKYQIKRCSGPCKGLIGRDEYSDRVRQAKLFLEGKTNSLIEELRGQMERASEELNFEKAAQLRDAIYALQNVTMQNVILDDFIDIDVLGLAKGVNHVVVVVLHLRDGVLRGKEVYNLDMATDEVESEIVSAFIKQYYSKNPPPDEIIVPVLPDDSEVILQWFLEDMNKEVRLSISHKNNKERLLCMANDNANEALQSLEDKETRDLQKVEILYESIPLKNYPKRIEAVDISNTGGILSVGSLVCFVDGKPYKKAYRHYTIKSVEGINDFAMIEEVLRRRFKKVDELPDLLLIDGGKGQLNIAVNVLKELNLFEKIDVLAISKGRRPGEIDRVYNSLGEDLGLSGHSKALHFLMEVRDEAHRFGITHHRNKRGRLQITSILDEIPNIGPKRKRLLLTHFGSVDALKNATFEELKQVKGLPESLAKDIYEFFHGNRVTR